MRRGLRTSCLLACTILTVTPASAQTSGEDLVRGLIGGIGGAMLQELERSTQPPARRTAPQRRPAMRSDPPQRAAPQRSAPQRVRTARPARPADRQLEQAQRWLNTLDFDAGSPDGQMGPRTERAIRSFERAAGFEPNGELSRFELRVLYDVADDATLLGVPRAR